MAANLSAPGRANAMTDRGRLAIRSTRSSVCFALVVLGSAALPASAADLTWFVQGGDGDRATTEATVGLTRHWASEGRWSVYAEAALGEWFTHDHAEGMRTRFTHVGLTPVVRYVFAELLFVEAGIGLQAVIPRFHDEGRRFSTVFQFGDHLAIGTRFGATNDDEVSFRVEHFSNGGIRNPNPGQNFLELRYAHHF